MHARLTGMVMSSGNASSNTCHYRQEALGESIGACTNDVALCIPTRTAKVLLLRQSFITLQGMLNVLYGWIDTNDKNILFFALINVRCKLVSRLDGI